MFNIPSRSANMLQEFLLIASADGKGKIADVDAVVAEAVDFVEGNDV